MRCECSLLPSIIPSLAAAPVFVLVVTLTVSVMLLTIVRLRVIRVVFATAVGRFSRIGFLGSVSVGSVLGLFLVSFVSWPGWLLLLVRIWLTSRFDGC